MGGGMEHIHHYCRGLAHTAHALFTAKTPQERTWALGYSIGEFDYMLHNAGLGKEFKLMPEVLKNKGENLIRLGKFTEALPVLLRAIEMKPDYWPPYVVLSDYYKDSGDLAKAREWLDKALAIAPESKTLRARQAALGGGKGARATDTVRRPAKPPAPEKPAAPAAEAEEPAPK